MKKLFISIVGGSILGMTSGIIAHFCGVPSNILPAVTIPTAGISTILFMVHL